jgi:RNA recognition motif-containing protein
MRKPIPNKNLKDKALDEILLNKSVSSKMEEQDEMWDGTDEITSDNSDKIMSDADEMIQKGYGKRE